MSEGPDRGPASWWWWHREVCPGALGADVVAVLEECYRWRWACAECGRRSPGYIDDIEPDAAGDAADGSDEEI